MSEGKRWAGLSPSSARCKTLTRLAASSYELWRDILATNTDHIERSLALYIQMLEHMRENLRTRQLQEEFQRGAAVAGRLRGAV